MKVDRVEVDVTMSVNLYIDARSEEEALKIAQEKIKSDTLYRLRNAAFVRSENTDIEEVN